MLKLTTDKHEASRGLCATAELFVTSVRELVIGLLFLCPMGRLIFTIV